jgi:voltage-gated potassium channel
VIISRAIDGASVPKLLRAGAIRTLSPYAIGGHRIAHLILSPTVVDFFETALRRGNEFLDIEALSADRASPAVGKRLDALDVPGATGALLMTILREGEAPVSPAGETVLEPGDRLLALGTADQLRRLEALVAAGR